MISPTLFSLTEKMALPTIGLRRNYSSQSFGIVAGRLTLFVQS